MPRRPKKPPWNAGLKIPGYGDTPPHVMQQAPDTVTVGHTIAPLPADSWECLRCERLRAGLEPTVPDHSPRCPYRASGRDPEPSG